tara:strand:+ start:3015 stop:3458 length:444 start_codon:yes stop_codon:yes gene_type:complete
MAITQTLTTSFKKELLEGNHDFTADTIKIALYDSTATLGASTTIYSAGDTGQVSNDAPGYDTGGKELTKVSPTSSGTTAFIDFSDITWTSSTFTARGALIYNASTKSSIANRAIAVLDFGSDKTTSNSTFTVTFPAGDSTNAIVRIE